MIAGAVDALEDRSNVDRPARYRKAAKCLAVGQNPGVQLFGVLLGREDSFW